MNDFWILVLGFGVLFALLGMVVWLKGTFLFVRDLSRATWDRRGEQWVQYALLEPILFLPFVFVAAAFKLAHPDSVWARWFYSDERLRRAQARYAVADAEEPQYEVVRNSRRRIV